MGTTVWNIREIKRSSITILKYDGSD